MFSTGQLFLKKIKWSRILIYRNNHDFYFNDCENSEWGERRGSLGEENESPARQSRSS